MKIISVVGARPNFMKIAPFIRAIDEHNKKQTPLLKERGQGGEVIQHLLVHTGQHYDERMSHTFFLELGIPQPDINLEIGSGSHAQQVGQTMIAFEKVLQTEKPDWVVVVGDVNATLACSVTAKKERIKCCHIEAGLRSGDLNMPEEINRLVTDRLSDLLLTPDPISSENLRKEGTPENKIVFVGNIMIDTLEYNRETAAALSFPNILKSNQLTPNDERLTHFSTLKEYGLITMHRPSNVDDKQILSAITNWITTDAANQIPLIWPIHPRTVKQLQTFNLWQNLLDCKNLLLLHPLGYLPMLKLNMSAKVMLTDSGGLQEECCVLGTPFLTLRWNTERPVTLLEHGGAGYLVGNNIQNITRDFNKIINEPRTPRTPQLWDGNAAQRCLNAILAHKD
ncbi:MAG: non-hydrolyzing UDP-N-acetylglucosamine 2-epimerase [Bacteroidia bacterium]